MNKQNTPHDNMSKIIYLSNIYQRHKKNLTQVKSSFDTQNKKFHQKNIDFLLSRARHTTALRKINQKIIQRQNQSFVHRVVQKSTHNNNISNSASKNKRYNSPPQNRYINNNNDQRTLSASSLRTASQRNLKSRQLQIQKQNSKMHFRIIKSHSKDSLGPKAMNQSYQKDIYYKNLRSRYSNKNKSLLEDMLTGLNVRKKNAQFLPQLINSRQINKSRQIKNQESRGLANSSSVKKRHSANIINNNNNNDNNNQNDKSKKLQKLKQNNNKLTYTKKKQLSFIK